MDIKLENGDIAALPSGDYISVKGIDEVLQRAVLCAQINKGSFIYNKALGTELRSIDIKSATALKTAQVLLEECLMKEADCSIKVRSLEEKEDGSLTVAIEVSDGENTRTAEVTLVADL